MKQVSFLTGVLLLVASADLSAQTSVGMVASAPPEVARVATPVDYAQQRAQLYADALGLSGKQTARLAEIFVGGENEVAGLRQQCLKIQDEVDAAMMKYDASAEQVLSPEQMEKLAMMKKEGNWHPVVVSCVAPATGKSDCAGHAAEGKAGGCCAGKAGAHGTAKPSAAPAK